MIDLSEVLLYGNTAPIRLVDTMHKYVFFLTVTLVLFIVYSNCSFPLELLTLMWFYLYFCSILPTFNTRISQSDKGWFMLNLIRRDFKNIYQVPLMLSHLSTNSCKILTHLHDIADIWYSTRRQKKQFR